MHLGLTLPAAFFFLFLPMQETVGGLRHGLLGAGDLAFHSVQEPVQNP